MHAKEKGTHKAHKAHKVTKVLKVMTGWQTTTSIFTLRDVWRDIKNVYTQYGFGADLSTDVMLNCSRYLFIYISGKALQWASTVQVTRPVLCYLFLLPYAVLEMVNAVCDKPAGQTWAEPNLVRVSQTANERKVFLPFIKRRGWKFC